MRYLNLPGTTLRPSIIGLGTVGLGTSLDPAASFRLLDAYLDQGGNVLDTAKVYADWVRGERSRSEKTIGRWLRQRRRRDQIILMTKGGHPDLARMQVPRLSRTELRADLHASLRHLGTDRIDLYWLHRDDERRPVAEILETLWGFQASGKIRYFGCSNWRQSRVVAAQAYAGQCGRVGFVASQAFWNLAYIDPTRLTDPTLVVLDSAFQAYHAAVGLPVFAYSAQATGWFHTRNAAAASPAQHAVYASPLNDLRRQRLYALAAETGWSISQLLIAYLLAQPFPAIPLIGCRTLEQLADSLPASAVNLTAEQVARLEGAAGGPAGQLVAGPQTG